MTSPIPWKSSEILEATKGILQFGGSHHSFSGISIDSRKISSNDVFVAIKGDTHDGYAFLSDVVRRGVRGFVIEQSKIGGLSCAEWKENGIVCIAVDDTRKALGNLAAFHRRRSNVSVAAITGSNGKTTTKEITSSVLSQRFNILSTQGNLNNDIGLPLTLLNLAPCHEWAVLELGMNRAGEIAALTQICKPNVGVITNIGPAHIGHLGSMEAILRAKAELLENMDADGTAILNADDPRIMQLADKITQKVILFGFSEHAAVRALSVKEKVGAVDFTLALPTGKTSVALQIPGKFMISNALAAAAVGYALGLTAQEIANGLEQFKPIKGRMNLINTHKKIHIIDDTYNANPGSMEAAIVTLKSLKANQRGILVIGDMLELGEYSESMHRNIGSQAGASGVARIYVTGKFAESVAEGAKNNGMELDNIFTGSKEEIIKDLTGFLQPNDWILVKGSRSMGMEKIVQEVKKWAELD